MGLASPQAGGTRVAEAASRVRSSIFFVILDTLIIITSYSIAEVVYFRDRAPSDYWVHFAMFLGTALILQLSANKLFGLYGRMWRHAGIEEARQILLAALSSMAVLIALHPIGRVLRVEIVPINVLVIGGIFVTIGMGALRFHSRLFAWQRGSKRMGLRVGVIGTRDAAASLVRDMLRSPKAGLVPVAVFEEDKAAHGLSLLGVPVVGGISDIADASERYSIQQIILAVSSPPPELVERALRASEAAGIVMKVMPSVREVVGAVGHPTTVRQAREPRIEDLLGRKQVATDLAAVHRSLADKRVLITGAGGSIGSEITLQVAAFGPESVVLLDHDETHLHDASGMLSCPHELALVDVTNRRAVFETFERYRPDVVFHAAAHKHVPVLENHPLEAASTNVLGTRNVVDAATATGVERFVFISTDKAVRPSSVMGASKWLGEQVTLAHAPENAPYCAVRFGNVLGSRGSVIPTFNRQISMGGPVTVTDPRMTRYFMSVREAVQLVLQASVLAEGGEIFMLEMGEPVRILDLAQRMIRLSGLSPGTDIPIRITGVRPGEKLEEELNAPEEEVHETSHASVHRLVPVGIGHDALSDVLFDLEEATEKRESPEVRTLLFSLLGARSRSVRA
ncbi:MAG: nucleoside-diphosphate sugar epimerase/dehydratase [Acidimicrobiales bacterium]